MNTLSLLLEKLTNHEHLSFDEAKTWMLEMMEGHWTSAQIAGFIASLRTKGETVDEIAGFASAMRDKAAMIHHRYPVLVDTCGTGGDKKGTFNISTLASLVVAGAGVPVAKHGNVAISSKCGSADLLKALGVKIDCGVKKMESILNDIGICFLFAPLHHSAMKHAAAPRKELGIRTVFNILGPLSNPAGANVQVLGVYQKDLTEKMAFVLQKLGVKKALIVHSEDGLDEATTTAKTWISETGEDKIKSYIIEPAAVGLRKSQMKDIRGGSIDENVAIAHDVLDAKEGPQQDIVVLNAALAIYAAGASQDIPIAIAIARETIVSGKARIVLETLKKLTLED